MTTESLRAESATANENGQLLPDETFFAAHSAWRYAKAQRELVMYAPEYVNKDVPDEIDIPLADAASRAFDEFIATPTESTGGLLWKLNAIRNEQAWMNTEVERYFAAIVEDVYRIGDRALERKG